MSDLDKNKPPPPRLIAERMTRLLRMQSSLVVILTAIGFSQLFAKHFLLAAAALVAAAASALIVFSLWKQHRVVKAGTAVYAVLPRSEFQMPQIVSIAVVLFDSVRWAMQCVYRLHHDCQLQYPSWMDVLRADTAGGVAVHRLLLVSHLYRKAVGKAGAASRTAGRGLASGSAQC